MVLLDSVRTRLDRDEGTGRRYQPEQPVAPIDCHHPLARDLVAR